MTGQQLKNSILQMAVQGKLVPQDPNDEPASVLLERIRAEKEQLTKEGKIKKEKNPSIIFRGADNLPYEKIGKNEPVCIADDVPFEITKIKNLMMKNLLSLQIKHHQGQEKLLLLVIFFILLYVHICIICALLIDPLAINLLLVLALRHLLVTLGFTINSCFII